MVPLFTLRSFPDGRGENAPSWVPFLDAAGLVVVHWSTVGDPRANDRELMDWARSNGCVVFTNDLDFSALLAIRRGAGPSTLQVRTQNLLPAAIGGTVVRCLWSIALFFSKARS